MGQILGALGLGTGAAGTGAAAAGSGSILGSGATSALGSLGVAPEIANAVGTTAGKAGAGLIERQIGATPLGQTLGRLQGASNLFAEVPGIDVPGAPATTGAQLGAQLSSSFGSGKLGTALGKFTANAIDNQLIKGGVSPIAGGGLGEKRSTPMLLADTLQQLAVSRAAQKSRLGSPGQVTRLSSTRFNLGR